MSPIYVLFSKYKDSFVFQGDHGEIFPALKVKLQISKRETFVLSPPLKKTILLIPTWRFYCLYVFLKINVGISRVFFSKGGKGQMFRNL